MTAKEIVSIVPGLMAISLVAKTIPKNFGMNPSKKMATKKNIKGLVKTGVRVLVGVGLIGAASKTINTL